MCIYILKSKNKIKYKIPQILKYLEFFLVFLKYFENNFYMVTRELPMEKDTIFYLYVR